MNHYISRYFSWFRSNFVRVLKYLQIKKGGPTFWGKPISQKVLIIWFLLLYHNFQSFLDQNSSSLIRFQCILHDSGVLFSESSNSYKLKRGDLISGGKQFWKKSELFRSPFCTLIIKVLWTQIFPHSLYFKAFCLIQEYFSKSFAISTNYRAGI